MKSKINCALAIGAVITFASSWSHEAEGTIERMPAQLESRFALSALPPSIREEATVYLLDPEKGYAILRQGSGNITCLVERTAWELADFRDDIYIPLCYDAAGARAHLKAIIDAAALRAQGMTATALKAEVEGRYKKKVYKAPEKPGLSYMLAPVMRTVGPPDMKVHTMPMPHVMFYAPGVTNEEIGAHPDLADPSSLLYPFIDRQGVAEQSYIIQLVGETERAKILADEKALVDDLCAYRAVLCLEHMKH
ncbi:MAG: hypothetical protein ACJ8MR_01995 [Povalibacter sp.]